MPFETPRTPLVLVHSAESVSSFEQKPYEELRDEAHRACEELFISPELESFTMECLDSLHAYHEPTATHNMRVGLLIYARMMQIFQKSCDSEDLSHAQVLFIAGLLHDYGKGLIPVEGVLEYPGRLRDDKKKWEYILQHPDMSAYLIRHKRRQWREQGKMLSSIDTKTLRHATEIIPFHHMFRVIEDCYPLHIAQNILDPIHPMSTHRLQAFADAFEIAAADFVDATCSRSDAQHDALELEDESMLFAIAERLINYFSSPEIFFRAVREHPKGMDHLLQRDGAHNGHMDDVAIERAIGQKMRAIMFAYLKVASEKGYTPLQIQLSMIRTTMQSAG